MKKKININSIPHIIKQIESVCKSDRKVLAKLLNNLSILIEKNVIIKNDNNKYFLEEKQNELRKLIHNLCFIRRGLTHEYAYQYHNKIESLLKKIEFNRKQCHREYDEFLIHFEDFTELDCSSIFSTIPSTFSKLKKCERAIDEDCKYNKVINENKHLMTYFKNL
ncbi:hypothetical protein A0H76_125 [Hepatospora eriocheir]|uniref:Uncharacterized protein n=1 Tax=Hepatospora eriocheir TaxID=1081669 RepID=A0A1X0QJ95_9MICR|nr:hypothetical protein A0H76_125 [Hepatospora eriocheir]